MRTVPMHRRMGVRCVKVRTVRVMAVWLVRVESRLVRVGSMNVHVGVRMGRVPVRRVEVGNMQMSEVRVG